MPGEHQVGQGEKGVELRRVLGEALVARPAVAKEVLEDVKGMLDQSTHLRLDFRWRPRARTPPAR